MKQADLFIFLGLLIVLFGLGEDTGKIFTSDLKRTVGIACISYGALLYLLSFKKIREYTFCVPRKLTDLPAKVYLGLGVLILRMDKILPFEEDNLTVITIKVILGIGITAYGLNRFFIEKRRKRESGNIEKD